MQYRCTQTTRTSLALRVCLFRLQAAATALINEEMFGNRAPFFRSDSLRQTAIRYRHTHTHAKARWIY